MFMAIDINSTDKNTIKLLRECKLNCVKLQ